MRARIRTVEVPSAMPGRMVREATLSLLRPAASLIPTRWPLRTTGDCSFRTTAPRSIHVVDMRDPCAGEEKAPLLPVSAADPTRVVVSGAIAVSPLTSDGKRFVYAVRREEQWQPHGVRREHHLDGAHTALASGPPLQPVRAADRVALTAPVEGMTFADPRSPARQTGSDDGRHPAWRPVRPDQSRRSERSRRRLRIGRGGATALARHLRLRRALERRSRASSTSTISTRNAAGLVTPMTSRSGARVRTFRRPVCHRRARRSAAKSSNGIGSGR